ncbi:hypothetical protein HDU77_011177, partial [Chytriomyces hyalinus]
MKLYVNLAVRDGIESTALNVDHSFSVGALKQVLEATWGMETSVMCLFKNGCHFQDDQETVADLGLQDRDTLKLIST